MTDEHTRTIAEAYTRLAKVGQRLLDEPDADERVEVSGSALRALARELRREPQPSDIFFTMSVS